MADCELFFAVATHCTNSKGRLVPYGTSGNAIFQASAIHMTGPAPLKLNPVRHIGCNMPSGI
jgi:hypothetical protein